MGRATLPSISSVTEVIELITDPDKYITYMKEFRRIHAEAEEALGALATKEALDLAVAKSVEDRVAFEREKADVKRALEAEAVENAHDRANLEAQIEKYRAEVDKEDAALEAKAQEIAKKYAEADQFVKQQEALWSIKFQELAQSTANLQVREDALAVAKAKIEPVAKALGVVLE